MLNTHTGTRTASACALTTATLRCTSAKLEYAVFCSLLVVRTFDWLARTSYALIESSHLLLTCTGCTQRNFQQRWHPVLFNIIWQAHTFMGYRNRVILLFFFFIFIHFSKSVFYLYPNSFCRQVVSTLTTGKVAYKQVLILSLHIIALSTKNHSNSLSQHHHIPSQWEHYLDSNVRAASFRRARYYNSCFCC